MSDTLDLQELIQLDRKRRSHHRQIIRLERIQEELDEELLILGHKKCAKRAKIDTVTGRTVSTGTRVYNYDAKTGKMVIKSTGTSQSRRTARKSQPTSSLQTTCTHHSLNDHHDGTGVDAHGLESPVEGM